MTTKTQAVIWCNGPATLWLDLTPLERLAVLLRPNLLPEVSSKFGNCGPQTVELDTSNPDDIWPAYCPVCQTDMNWDMEMFWELHPEFKGPDEED